MGVSTSAKAKDVNYSSTTIKNPLKVNIRSTYFTQTLKEMKVIYETG